MSCVSWCVYECGTGLYIRIYRRASLHIPTNAHVIRASVCARARQSHLANWAQKTVIISCLIDFSLDGVEALLSALQTISRSTTSTNVSVKTRGADCAIIQLITTQHNALFSCLFFVHVCLFVITICLSMQETIKSSCFHGCTTTCAVNAGKLRV